MARFGWVYLFLEGKVQAGGQAGFGAGDRVRFDDAFASSFVESLDEIREDRLGFGSVVGFKCLAELALHSVDRAGTSSVAERAVIGLTERLNCVLEIWHRMRRSVAEWADSVKEQP